MLTSNFRQKLIRSSKPNPCSICFKDHGCRLSESLIICLRGDRHWSIKGWTYKKQAKGGMGSVWVSNQDNNNPPKLENRATQDATTKATLKRLTDEELNQNALHIFKYLGLSTKHRQILRERGLTSSEIDQIGFKSIDPYQEFLTSPKLNFPGMGSKGTLTNGDSGYLIPVRNLKGLIIGFQMANDHRGEQNKKGEEISKYVWLWGSSARRVCQELPLQVLRLSESTDLNIIEGIQKPLIAAHKHSINVLGSGGVQWQNSPKEFQGIIESGLFTRYILNPDTGCQNNSHVLKAYWELFKFLNQQGIQLCVREWGQSDRPKSEQLDIDEIDSILFQNTAIISFEQWLKIQPKSEKSHDKIISSTQWLKQFKLPQLQEKLEESVNKLFGKTLKECPVKPPENQDEIKPQTQVLSSAIVPWKPQPLPTLSYTPGQLPTFKEWEQLGSPRLIIQKGQRLTFYQEAYLRGFKFIKDSTPTGYGKSHDAGLIDLKTFEIDPDDKNNHTRIFYLDPNHRNPTNATVETHYIDLESRHDGLMYDLTRKTCLGDPYLIRANSSNKTVEIPSNCPENQTFLTVAEIGIPIFGGKDSPICQSCPLLLKGCTFLQNRRNTLANERLIRADINSLPNPSEHDILIIEESDTNVKTSYQIRIKIEEVIKTIGKLQLTDDHRIFPALRPILIAVYQALESVTQDKYKYGIPHQKVRELLPSADQLNQVIWELYSEDWLKAKDVWGQPVWHYEMMNGEPEAIKAIGENWIAPSLHDLKKECYKIFDNYAKYLNSLQTPQEKQAAIKANVIPAWLPALIDCLTGNKQINLQIDNGKLIITRLAKRHRNIIKSAGFSIALDATQSKEDYALSIGVNPNCILEVREVPRLTPNLNIHIITALGKGCKQRRETLQHRIKMAIQGISRRHQGQNIGLIDHKSAMGNYHDLAYEKGYWGRDNRGSNRFLATQIMISIGKLVPNLGQMAAEFQILTRWVNTPDELTGRYGQWVNRKITSELIQDVGRLRAHLRPDEDLHSYLVADLEEDTITQIRLAFPGATVTVEDVYKYAPEAATKGMRTERAIIQALWSSMQSGVPMTIEQIAKLLGITKGGVSKNLKDRLGIGFRMLKKSLLLLLEALNSKSKLSDLADEVRWIAETYLPLVAQSLDEGEITPMDVVVEIINTAKAFGEQVFRQILEATTLPTILHSLIPCELFTQTTSTNEHSPILSPH